MQAVGGCDTVKYVSGIPSYQNNLYDNSQEWWYDGGCRVITLWPTFVMYPRMFLQKLDHSTQSWTTVAGPNYPGNFHFTNLDHGTYRLYVQIPVIQLLITCGESQPGPILVYNTAWQHLGYAGYYYTPSANDPTYYSNPVVVGETVSTDNNYTFIDEPETGSVFAYDYGETVILDATESINYDFWWIAIFESGPHYNRYLSNGWTSGTIGQFNISEFWSTGGSGWELEPFHSYTIQFVVENEQCKNTPQWNNNDTNIFICPSGTGCKPAFIAAPEITMYPNPAAGRVFFKGLEFSLASRYDVRISDIAGRMLLEERIISEELDISVLQSGLYVVQLQKNGENHHSARLVVR